MNAARTLPTDKLVDRLFVRSSVSEIEPITSRMRRIRLAINRLEPLPFTPGQQVRVLVTELFSVETLRTVFRDSLRTYSVWDHDPEAGTLDLCVLDHGDGPGARWSRRIKVGDSVSFRGPEGSFVLAPPAPYQLFIGEETAQVAFGAILRVLAPHATVHGVIEVDASSDRLPLRHTEEITWLYRHGAPAERSATLIEALRSLDLPSPPGFAYIAGESKTCAVARRHLVEERGWPARSAIAVKPFWTPGKKGLE
jgi:NADPH-dependent ferric siderophore reductase